MFLKQLQYLFSKNLLNLVQNFLIAFGTIWLFIEFPSYMIKAMEDYIKSNNLSILILALVVSLLYGVLRAFPRTKYTRLFKASNTSITVKVGDLFAEKKHIVIGSSDFFDTDYDVNSNISMKSQMINKLFPGNVSLLDHIIETDMTSQNVLGQHEPLKLSGKKIKYPIGTTAIIPNNGNRIFLLIIANLIYAHHNKHTESDPQKLNTALNSLWDKIKTEGRMKEVSLPVLGSGLAGVNLSHLLIMQLIILSFTIYSKRTRITPELNIIVAERNYDPSDFEETCRFLQTIQI